MVGKIVPYVLIGLIQMTLILRSALAVRRAGRGSLARPVPRRAASSSPPRSRSGLVISTVAQTQFQAFQLAFVTAAVDPALGLHVPVRRHAAVAQWIAQVLPLTHFVEIVRGIVLRGATLADMRPGLEAAVFLAVMLALARCASASASTRGRSPLALPP